MDQPSVIIGAGTLGKALAEWGDTGQDVVLGRGEEIPSEIVLTGAWEGGCKWVSINRLCGSCRRLILTD